MNDKIPGIVKTDPWLTSVIQDVNDRVQRFNQRLEQIETEHSTLSAFADEYKFLGIHFSNRHKGWYYREWAPSAKQLFLSGDFNDWNPHSHPLTRVDNDIWEIFIDQKTYKHKFVHGSKIKVWVEGNHGFLPRIPAYITRVVQDEDTKNYSGQLWFNHFDWNDDNFRLKKDGKLFIYECHVGMAQEKEGLGTYLEFADKILPWVKEAGYNAIQLMAIQEHPYYGSFGYHVANFFAPSSRFGTPEDLKYLIKTAHEMGIAVIMDIVHSHTVKNINEGLNMFDGSDHQYFHPGPRGIHPQWDSMLFDYGRTEVLRFLLSNVKYWMEEFHFDGFRFDGVGSMMYFHHGNEPIDTPEKYFSQGVEWDAITYLQLANKLAHQLLPGAITIAEDVTGMPGLTAPISQGGMAFDYRLGMGIPDFWIKLLKEYKDEDWSINEIWSVLTNRLPGVKTIAYAESHDQALVGDKTLAFWLMDKEMYYHMHVSDTNIVVDRGIALHKMIRLITIGLGGVAYLNFMGNEFGHPEWIDFPRIGNNWSYQYARRQWSLAWNPELKYKYLALFDKQMIELIKENNVFDDEYANQLQMDEPNKIIVFERGNLLFLFNFHPVNSIADYAFPISIPGDYRIILNTDAAQLGGHGRIDESIVYSSMYDKESEKNLLRIYTTNRTAIVAKKFS
ncbi:MAG: alpha amylase C-terminal domain-containing protein [Lentimicrobium sp.]|jgi:1,4-alpha-glucan branching enzyme|nr:alpha amylase C-terminal domain-containing protein [Lentimicrobium sp.]